MHVAYIREARFWLVCLYSQFTVSNEAACKSNFLHEPGFSRLGGGLNCLSAIYQDAC